jgi:hypothetical protein
MIFKKSMSALICAFVLNMGLVGCASNTSKRWLATGAGFSAGLALGTATAPAGERKELHSVYWGALLGLGVSLVAGEIWNDEDEIARLRHENRNLGLQLELIQNANTVLLKEGKGYFKSAQGEELFSSGKARWRLYQIDRWVRAGPNQLFHQDKMVELLPLNDEEKK